MRCTNPQCGRVGVEQPDASTCVECGTELVDGSPRPPRTAVKQAPQTR